MLTQGTTFRCGAHGSLARDIDKQLCKRLSNKSKKGISVQYGYGTVLYSTELYSTVQYDAVKRSVEIRSLSRPPPLHIPLTPVVVTAEISGEEVRCRIALRETTWRHQIR